MNFRAVLVLPKMAGSAQTHKSMSFIWIVWSTLYVYLWYLSRKMQNPHYIKRHFMRDLWDLLFEWNPFLEMIWRFKRKRNPALRVFAPGMGRFFFRSCCCLYSSSTNFEFLHKDLEWLGHFLKKKRNNISPFKKGAYVI